MFIVVRAEVGIRFDSALSDNHDTYTATLLHYFVIHNSIRR
jgi:hypothetical protein